ncbi:response regulator [Microbacterium suaedae]|uniref:response regulator n=1 Tax=Microbacterium suaedae TaxID=2067813 RepID=UPI001E5EC57A|nr:response regulator transcription factor [Microbacterium suaedae]
MLIVDDESLMRHGIRTFLGVDDRIDVVGEAAGGADVLEACRELMPDVVLMDIRMPRVGGVEATRRIVEAGLPCRVLALTTFTTEWRVVELLRAGAHGYLVKDSTPEALADAVIATHAGDRVLAPAVQTSLVKKMLATAPHAAATAIRADGLSERELRVVELIADGLSNAQIARELSYSEATVKADINRINCKWGVENRLQVVLHAAEASLVSL